MVGRYYPRKRKSRGVVVLKQGSRHHVVKKESPVKALFGCAGPVPLTFQNEGKAVFTPEMDAKRNKA